MAWLAQALAHLHSRGIFHRDIKPENILVTRDSLRLADFGSCRGVHAKAGPCPALHCSRNMKMQARDARRCCAGALHRVHQHALVQSARVPAHRRCAGAACKAAWPAFATHGLTSCWLPAPGYYSQKMDLWVRCCCCSCGARSLHV